MYLYSLKERQRIEGEKGRVRERKRPLSSHPRGEATYMYIHTQKDSGNVKRERKKETS